MAKGADLRSVVHVLRTAPPAFDHMAENYEMATKLILAEETPVIDGAADVVSLTPEAVKQMRRAADALEELAAAIQLKGATK